MVQLVVDKEPQVFKHGRLYFCLCARGYGVALLVNINGSLYGLAGHSGPGLVLVGVTALVHAWEKHV